MSDTPSPAPVIHVSAVVFSDPTGRILVVRKRGTSTFMLPGGKFEPGESPADAAIRESAEEIGVIVTPATLEVLGHFVAAAANEPDHLVDAHVFRMAGTVDADETLANIPASEIAEVRWVDMDIDAAALALAPLLTDCVWPMLTGPGGTHRGDTDV